MMHHITSYRASLVVQTVKNLHAMQETQVQSLVREDPLETGMATHCSILAWKIPWTEEPGGLQSMGLQREKCKSKLQWGVTSHQSEWVSESHSVVSDSLRPCGLYSPWNSPGQNTGVGSLSLLQGIFPTQESNPGLPHCRQILYQLSHKRAQEYPSG